MNFGAWGQNQLGSSSSSIYTAFSWRSLGQEEPAGRRTIASRGAQLYQDIGVSCAFFHSSVRDSYV